VSPQQSIGHCRILEKLGEGGMGVVRELAGDPSRTKYGPLGNSPDSGAALKKSRSVPLASSRVVHVKRTLLKGLRFESMKEAQAYLDRWEERWADTRIHGITKRQVAVVFAEERPALLPLPVEPFRYYQFGQPTVHLDGCVEVEAASYGAPPASDEPARPGSAGWPARPPAGSEDGPTAARVPAPAARRLSD
jgi:hypothetical protein